MLLFLSQFAWNLTTVGVLLLFHVLALQSLLAVLRRRRPVRGRRVWSWGMTVILLLDLPPAYLQLLYKSLHPLWADQILSAIWIPWVLLQANAFLVGTFLLAGELLYQPLKRYMSRRRKQDVAGALSGGDKDDVRVEAEGTIAAPVPRRKFIRSAALALGGIAANASLLSAADSDEDARVERVKIRVPNLPKELRGTTIGMISDIHSSIFMDRERMESYAGILSSLKADLIVLPGDFVNSRVREVYPFAEAFCRLSAPLGVYGVTGNHDYYTREIDLVTKEVEQAGIKILNNENVRIEKNGKTFRLLGMDDKKIYHVNDYLKTGKTEEGTIENLMKGVDEKETKILLCHKPYPFEEYAELGVDLMLSGHTHGGQIVLARLDRLNVSVASLASTYISGLYKAHANHDAQMYISRGIGTAGIPLRLNCPPEITHIMLV